MRNNKLGRELRLDKNGVGLFSKVCRNDAEVTCSGTGRHFSCRCVNQQQETLYR